MAAGLCSRAVRDPQARLPTRPKHAPNQEPKEGKGSWPADPKKDGILMQLEARGARAVFFTELTTTKGQFSVGETHQLDAEEFGLFPRLFS